MKEERGEQVDQRRVKKEREKEMETKTNRRRNGKERKIKVSAEMNSKGETDDTDTPTHREMKRKKNILLHFSLLLAGRSPPPSIILPAQKWRGGTLVSGGQ